MKLVVCDDDVTLRGVVSKLATDAGHAVLAETDSAADAVDIILRFGAEALILDLALPWGGGMRVVNELRESGSPCQVVVFTSYAAESPDVREAGVRAVIEKPDFEALVQVLDELAKGYTAETPTGAERRRTFEPRSSMPPPGVPSVSGVESPQTFADALFHLEPGDAVLVVHVANAVVAAGWFARLVGADRTLAVARNLRGVLRTQDRLTVGEPDSDDRIHDLHALLLGGGRPGVESVFRRLERAHAASTLPGVVSGGWALAEPGLAGGLVVARAQDAAQRSVGRPEGDRLWAG
jgi:CheY-like chemotaxis protein